MASELRKFGKIGVLYRARVLRKLASVTLAAVVVSCFHCFSQELNQQELPGCETCQATLPMQVLGRDPRGQVFLPRITKGKGVSIELKRVFVSEHIPMPSSITVSSRELTEDQLMALVWMRHYKEEISHTAKEFNITPRAISGVIAWEALENPHSFSFVSAGLGKPHICNMSRLACGVAFGYARLSNQDAVYGVDETAIQEVEGHYGIPRRTLKERVEVLSTTQGALTYIGAILRAGADAAAQAGRGDIHDNPGVLAQFYRGYTLRTWRNKLKEKPPGTPIEMADPMGSWIEANQLFLDDGLFDPLEHDARFEAVDRQSAELNRLVPQIKTAQRQARRTALTIDEYAALSDLRRQSLLDAKWDYLRTLVGFACSSPGDLRTLDDQGEIVGVTLPASDLEAFVGHDSGQMSRCEREIFSKILVTQGGASVAQLVDWGITYRSEHNLRVTLQKLLAKMQAFGVETGRAFASLGQALGQALQQPLSSGSGSDSDSRSGGNSSSYRESGSNGVFHDSPALNQARGINASGIWPD